VQTILLLLHENTSKRVK